MEFAWIGDMLRIVSRFASFSLSLLLVLLLVYLVELFEFAMLRNEDCVLVYLSASGFMTSLS